MARTAVRATILCPGKTSLCQSRIYHRGCNHTLLYHGWGVSFGVRPRVKGSMISKTVRSQSKPDVIWQHPYDKKGCDYAGAFPPN